MGPWQTAHRGAVLPAVLVTLTLISGLLGVFWQRVLDQADLSLNSAVHDPSQAALISAQARAQRRIENAVMTIRFLPGSGPGPTATTTVLEAAGLEAPLWNGTQVFTRWSVVGPACDPVGVATGAQGAEAPGAACTESVRFMVWTGQVGLWPRHVAELSWQLDWAVGADGHTPSVRRAAVRRWR